MVSPSPSPARGRLVCGSDIGATAPRLLAAPPVCAPTRMPGRAAVNAVVESHAALTDVHGRRSLHATGVHRRALSWAVYLVRGRQWRSLGVSACPRSSPTRQTGHRRLPDGSYVLEPSCTGAMPSLSPPSWR